MVTEEAREIRSESRGLPSLSSARGADHQELIHLPATTNVLVVLFAAVEICRIIGRLDVSGMVILLTPYPSAIGALRYFLTKVACASHSSSPTSQPRLRREIRVTFCQ